MAENDIYAVIEAEREHWSQLVGGAPLQVQQWLDFIRHQLDKTEIACEYGHWDEVREHLISIAALAIAGTGSYDLMQSASQSADEQSDTSLPRLGMVAHTPERYQSEYILNDSGGVGWRLTSAGRVEASHDLLVLCERVDTDGEIMWACRQTFSGITEDEFYGDDLLSEGYNGGSWVASSLVRRLERVFQLSCSRDSSRRAENQTGEMGKSQ